ncbi:hypothetical protein M9434_002824 [Picochlorum sp. BPE23]|nr:hypothetical protein M9434_002824 [Picochlorum sp. BPE23]
MFSRSLDIFDGNIANRERLLCCRTQPSSSGTAAPCSNPLPKHIFDSPIGNFFTFGRDSLQLPRCAV